MSLFVILQTYLFSDITSNAAFAILQKGISRFFQKHPVELFLDSIDETVKANVPSLSRFTQNGQVKFCRDKLSSEINIREVERSDTLATIQEPDVQDQLIEIFVSQYLIEIGGHQLDTVTYSNLVRQILEEAKKRFYDKLAQNRVAFNRVLLEETEHNTNLLDEIKSYLSVHNRILHQLSTDHQEILHEIQDLRQEFRQSGKAVPELEIEAPEIHPRLMKPDNRLSQTFVVSIEDNVAISTAPVDYLAYLKQGISEKGYVERKQAIQDIEAYLTKGTTVAIVGEPGIGKTFLLGHLAGEKQAVYISLKGQTILQVCSYLANRLRILRGVQPIRIQAENEAWWQLEDELQHFPTVLLIDDVDQEPEIAQKLLSIQLSNASMVLAARTSLSFGERIIPIYEMPPFSPEEIQSLLSVLNLDLPPSKIQELRQVSNGNPLYLYYFSIEQIEPLPHGISAYQEAIWRGLGAQDREILTFVSISFAPITLKELHRAKALLDSSTGSLMETAEHLERLKPIVFVIDEHFELFHPFFAEFVGQHAQDYGLAKQYHKVLGDIALQDKRILESTYHLMRAGDDRAQEHYLHAAHLAFLRGYRKLAREFLDKNLSLVEQSSDHDVIGQTHFMLAHLYMETGYLSESKEHARQAIAHFESAGDIEYAKHIESWSNTAFLNDFDPHIAIQKGQEVVNFFRGKNTELEAAALVNLSKILVETSRFREGLEAAKQAYEILKAQNNREGMLISMINISTCLNGLGDLDEQLKYSRIIIDAADELNRPQLRMAGLNHLAICQRKRDQPKEAIESLEEGISIAQNLDDISRVVMYLNNLGNVYFDLKDFTQSERCYLDALHKAQEHNLIKEEGRALELLARIESRRLNYAEVLQLSQDAIARYSSIKDDFRIASTLEYVGWAYSETKQFILAAENYQRAAEIYLDFETLKDATENFEEAGDNWLKANETSKALDCYRRGIHCAMSIDEAPDLLASLLESSINIDNTTTNYFNEFFELLRRYIQIAENKSFAFFMFGFSAALKLCPDAPERRKLFCQAVDELLSAIATNPHPNLLNALCLLIEQADERLVDEDGFENLVTRTIECIDGLYRRRVSEDHEIYTIGFRWDDEFIAQVVCWMPDLMSRRISFVIALILAANRGLLGEKVVGLGGTHEKGFELNIITETEFEANVTQLSESERRTPDLPFTISESNVPWDESQPEAVAILYDNYSQATDWSSRPDNKSFIWVLMVLYGAVVGHCTHQKRDGLARQAREFVDAVL